MKVAAAWYEKQRAGLGSEFLDQVVTTLAAIRDQPESYPVIHRNTHRALLAKFPFAVFYRIVGSEVVVVSVMHGSRNPSRWMDRDRYALNEAAGTVLRTETYESAAGREPSEMTLVRRAENKGA